MNIPPTNPSTVFFGDNADSCVFPNNLPKIYALISLQITRPQGRINQTNPLNMLHIIKDDCTPKIRIMK